MDSYGSYNEHQPVTWIRGYPVYAAHLIVAVFVASMIGTAILMFARWHGILDWLTYDSTAVLQGQAWRILTYGLVNPPDIWFAVDMLMIVWFGREVERHFGRRLFLWLYGGLYLLTPLLYTIIGLWRPVHTAGESGGFGLFIAFAVLYPEALMLFNLLAKWVAAVLVGLYSLIHLSNRNTIGLISLWATVGFAFLFVRVQQGRITLPRFNFSRPKPKLRVLPSPEPRRPVTTTSVGETSMAEVDALLDKIAHSGISSLTARERAKLDAARDDLRRRESERR